MKNQELFKILQNITECADDYAYMDRTVIEHLADYGLDMKYLKWREDPDTRMAEAIHSKLSRDELNALFQWHKQNIIYDMFDPYL